MVIVIIIVIHIQGCGSHSTKGANAPPTFRPTVPS